MINLSNLTRPAARHFVLLAAVCLSGVVGAGAAAQGGPSRTSSRGTLSGSVCKTVLRNKKPSQKDCTYEEGILVRARRRNANRAGNEPGVPSSPIPARTDKEGKFEIPIDKPGYYELEVVYRGYTLYPVALLWVDNVTREYDIDPPPLYLTSNQSASAPAQGGAELVLVLYRAGEPSPLPVGARPPQGGLVIKGRVVDSAGGPVGGAVVTISVEAGAAVEPSTLAQTVTDDDGYFSISKEGAEGDYILSVEDEGFSRFVALYGKEEAPPEEIVLKSISFIDEPLLERSEAARGNVFTPRLMEALPVEGLRNFDTFALLAPGVAPPPETSNTRGPGVSPGLGTAGQFSVNGLRSRENNFTVDGSDNNDEDIGTRRQGFVALAPQAIESLNEFQIITALPDARFGRNIGGQVDALTKSGTPKFHGSLYGFATDHRLNARDYFDGDTSGGPASFTLRRQSDGAEVLLDGRPVVTPNPAGGENPLTRTQLGFVVGGPVPRVAASFFTTLERVKSRANTESHFVVPTVEQRGLFDAGATGLLLNPDGPAPRPVYPSTIPGDAVFSLYPFPNNPLGPFGRNTYTTNLASDAEGTRLSAKIDRQFGTADATKIRMPWSLFNGGDTLTGRYNFSQETSTIPVTGQALFSTLRPRVRTQNIAFYLNRQLTPNLSDVIRFSFGRTKLTFREARDPFLSPSTFFPDETFLLNAPLLLNVTAPLAGGALTQPAYVSAASPQGAALLNALGYAGLTHAEQIAGPLGQVVVPGFSPLGVDVYHFPQSRANNSIQAADTVTYFSPKGHIYIFGFDMRKTQINSTLDRNFRPQAVFGGLRSTAAPPASGFAVGLPGGTPLAPRAFSPTTLAAAGAPTGLFQTLAVTPNSTVSLRFTQASLFAQRDWRPVDNLNVIVGARLNFVSLPHTKGKLLERAFDPTELERQGREAVEDCVEMSGVRAACERTARAIVSSIPGDFRASFGGDRLDLDGRLGAAWSLGGLTVLRGGFGVYSGEFPGIVIGQARNAFPGFLPLNFADLPAHLGNDLTDRVFLFNPANPLIRAAEPTLALAPGSLNTLLPGVNAVSLLTTRVALDATARPFARNVLGLDLVLPQRELQTPYSMHYALTLEQQIASRYALAVAYVGTRGLKLLRPSTPDLGPLRSRLLDPPVLHFGTQGPHPFPLLAGVLLPPQESIPDSLLAIARTFYESSASSSYHSLQVELRKHYAERFQFRTALTYSHAIDDASDFFDTAGAFALPQDSLTRSERASSNYDVRVRSVTHFVRDFPKDLFFAGSRWGGWQVAGIFTAQSGQPFTVNSAFDINQDGNLTDRLNRTDGLVEGGPGGDRLVQLSLAPGTSPLSLLADDFRDGRVGRNTFRAPRQFHFDLAVTKFFNFNERVRLHARAEVFNFFNHANFGIPVRILESPAFGRSTYTTAPPRTVQLVAKLMF